MLIKPIWKTMPIKPSRKSSDINYSPDWIQAIHGFHFLTLMLSNMAMNFSQNLFRSDPLKSIGISWSQGPRHQKGPRRNLQRQSAAGPRLCGAPNRKVWSFECLKGFKPHGQGTAKEQIQMGEHLAMENGECCHLDHFSRDVSHTLVAIQRKHDHEGGMKATTFWGEQPTQMALQPIRV